MEDNRVEEEEEEESCKLFEANGGGDRTRTCIAFRPAVFKTAALPLCDPSARVAR